VRCIWRFLLLFAVVCSAAAQGGEIPGLPSQLPPTIDRDFDVSFVNDFIGRGGSTDDFRTQQLISAAKLGERWTGLIDHSILTRNSVELTERTDTLSGSLEARLPGFHTPRSARPMQQSGLMRNVT